MIRSVLLLLVALLCVPAAWHEFRAGAAETFAQARTAEGLRKALEYTPHDAAKWRQLGNVLIRAGSPEALQMFQRAVTLAPSDAEALVGLALEFERTGRPELAQTTYARALTLSRRFKPLYAMASFHARRGELDEFWRCAERASNIPGSDPTRIFQLAVSTGTDPNRIPELLDLRSDAARTAWVTFALAHDHLDSAALIARDITPGEDHRTLLARVCHRLIETGRAHIAVPLWNRMTSAAQLDPERGNSLLPLQLVDSVPVAFGWRYLGVEGASAMQSTNSSGVRLEFSGDQPEQARIIDTVAPVLPGHPYRLSIHHATENITDPTGLFWAVIPAAGGITALVSSAIVSRTDSTVADFSVPTDCSAVRIVLMYRRAPGTVRITGNLQLHSARLDLRS